MGQLSAKISFFLALIFSVVCGVSAEAHTPTLGGNGVPVRWFGQPRLALAGNSTNQSGLSPQDFYSAVVHGLQRWNAASYGTVLFDYWQGTDPRVYEPNSAYNGLSSIYFASNAGGANLSSNVLGLTQVWYDTSNGRILETDIVLNDVNYRFTLNPRDTSGYGGGSVGGRNVFIENVITHELGHAFGLSHSGGLQSTMLFMESPEQAYLSCDEQSGIRGLYRGSAADGAGSIVGTVVSDRTGQAVFGAQVQAISRERGTVISSAITDRMGRYALGQLPPGQYYLMVEPFYAGSGALPGYYAGMSAAICEGGRNFGRSFLTEGSDSHLRAVAVSGGTLITAPDLSARCSSAASYGNRPTASVNAMSGTANLSTAPVVASGDETGFGVVDRFDLAGSARYFRLSGISGDLQLNAIGYGLYSPVRLSLRLLDSRGSSVSTRLIAPMYSSENSGYVNYDAVLFAQALAPGDYFVEVRASMLGDASFPAGPYSTDTVPFFILSGMPAAAGIGPGEVATSTRCKMTENFPAYSSPPGPPERHSTEKDSDKVGFCGNIRMMQNGSGGDRGGSGPAGGTGAGAIVGWFFPWVAALAALRYRRGVLRGRRATVNLGG